MQATSEDDDERSGSLASLGGRYIIREAFIGDAFSVLSDLRTADRVEWDRSVDGGVSRLHDSIMASAECYSVLGADDDVAHIIFGVVPRPEPTVWLLGTNQGQRDAFWILQRLREFYTAFFSRWPNVVCFTSPYNTVHHRWLEWMGFEFVKAAPWGDFGETFYEYRRAARRPDA